MFLNQLHPARQRFINKGLDYRNLIVYDIIQNQTCIWIFLTTATLWIKEL